jgi:hypothetical protein
LDRVKEEVEQIDEISKEKLSSYVGKAKEHVKSLEKAFDQGDRSQKRATDIRKRDRGISQAQHKIMKKNVVPAKPSTAPKHDSSPAGYYASKKPGQYVGDSVEVEGTPISEISSGLLDRYKEKAKVSADKLHSQEKYGKSADRWSNIMKATGKQIQHTTKNISKSLAREDAFQDSQAATPMPFDTGNNPAEVSNNPGMSKKTEKVMKIVKSHKVVKEDLYDHEKDNKTPQTVGKPKVTSQKDLAYGEGRPDAAVVLSGGKTMTGEPRDTIEIDPMMKKAKNGDVNTPSMDGKAETKKENK